ncbi:DUF4832 domain-containing protein [Ornithinibacillus salinisoli]|uniref:DUF4832 domain-containing protein n=1 Tax=Ornithinibacillus salinisoli TaxID=1848459 RepID=A0ABW4VVX4_9BACI
MNVLIVIILLVVVFIIMFNKTFFPSSQVEEVTVNPFMGFAPPADGGPYSQPHSLVYANLTWRELEPEKGFYDFESIEEKFRLTYWKNQNIKLIFRVVLDYPRESSHMDIPDWLYEEINQDGTWYKHEWGSGFSPNYYNNTLIDYHKKLIEAVAEKYDHEPAIAFVELGSLGHWGEWHTLQEDGIYIPFPKLPTAETYVNHYTDNFKNKILLMRRPHQIAINNEMGLYNDMFGRYDHTIEEFLSWINDGYEFWLTNEQNPAMPDAWKSRPIGGEFAPTDDWSDYFSTSKFLRVMEQLQATHVSWLGPSSPTYYPTDGKLQARINQFLNKIGYHFRLIQTSVNKTEVTMQWENRGVAPFYFPWPVELSLADQDGKIVYQQLLDGIDIRAWLPGKHTEVANLDISNEITAGTYQLLVAILDPETMKPGIQLEMEEKLPDGRYKIGEVTID